MASEIPNAVIPQESQGLSITEYLGVFQRRPFTIAIPAVLLLAVAAVVAFVVPRKYSTFTRIKISDPQLEKDLVGNTQAPIVIKPRLQTIDTDIKNRGFLEPILREIGLTEGFSVRDPKELNELYEYIDANLVIQPKIAKVGADTIVFSYTGRDARKTVEFLNKVREKYTKDVFQQELKSRVFSEYSHVRANLEELKRKRSEIMSRYQAFKSENETELIGTEREQRKFLLTLQGDRSQLEQEILEHGIELEGVQRQLKDLRPQDEVLTQAPNPAVVQLANLKAQMQARLDQLLAVYTESAPDVKNLRQQMQEVDKKIAELPPFVDASKTYQPSAIYEEQQKRKLTLLNLRQVKQQSLNRLVAQIEEIRKQVDRVPEMRRQLDEFTDKLDEISAQIKYLQVDNDRMKRTWENVSGKGSDLVTVQYWPRSDGDPVFPNVPIFLVVGFGAGLLLGVGLAFMKEFAGMTFNTTAQVQSVLPITVLGEVSHIVTENERDARRKKRRRLWIVVGIVFAALVALHVLYLNEAPSRHLPPGVIQLLDKIYKGR